AQAAPGRLMIRPEVRPGMCPDLEVWALSPGPPLCEFQNGMMPCRPPVGAGEASAWFPRPSEVAFPGPCIVLQCIPMLALPEDVSAVEKEMEQLAKELRQKRMTLGYSQADVGLLMGDLFGRALSQTTICHFEAQQLSLTNMWKLRLLLKMWLEQVDMENLLGLCKIETILQQAGKRRRAYRERRIGNSLEKPFLQCQKPTPQQISCIAGQLRLQKDFVQVWFHNWSKMGSRPSNDFSP
ncbi:PREDICTED: POU domain, class 5, transcription factor 2-like, partial [Lipotes vexillifer]